jgi:hypothetical protein
MLLAVTLSSVETELRNGCYIHLFTLCDDALSVSGLWNERLCVTNWKAVRWRGRGFSQPTISRPVRLGARRPSGTRDQFIFLLEIFF